METQMFRIFGLGPATFGIVIILVFSTILAGIAGRNKGLPGVLGVFILTVSIVCSLVFWPTRPSSESIQETGPADVIFLPRILLLIFLLIAFIRVLVQIVRHCLLDVSRAASVSQRHYRRAVVN